MRALTGIGMWAVQTARRCAGDNQAGCASGDSHMRIQDSMSSRLQRIPPAAIEVTLGTMVSSSRMTRLPCGVRMCGCATLPTSARFHSPTWQRDRPSGWNSSRLTSSSYGTPPAAAATSPATTYNRLS